MSGSVVEIFPDNIHNVLGAKIVGRFDGNLLLDNGLILGATAEHGADVWLVYTHPNKEQLAKDIKVIDDTLISLQKRREQLSQLWEVNNYGS